MNVRKKTIPNNLKVYRLKAGFTQKDVAKKLGFTNEVSICHWEQGKNIPNLVNISRLCAMYHATVEKLYDELFREIYK